MSEQLGKLAGLGLARLTELSVRATVIMFFAAALHEQFGVWSAIGWVESLPWAAVYAMVVYVVKPMKEERDEG